jgi:diacylglycerol kinase family enzyme
MLVALIVNPQATRVSERVRREVTAALAAEHKVQVHSSGEPGHGVQLTRRAVDDGAELVVVLGGDGTVNEVVNGLSGSSVPLGLVGGGKTNVFARGLGLPADTPRACARLLELLRAGSLRRVSLGSADGRAFTFGAGLGLDGAIVREVERRRRARQLYGDPAYVTAGLKTLFLSYDREHPHLKLRRAPGRASLTGFFALVANGDPFTYLGRRPFRPTPLATWEGGLDVLVGQTMSVRAITRALTGMLSPRPRAIYPRFPVLHDERRFVLESDVPLAFQLDGEYLGDHTRIAFRVEEQALEVVAPTGPGAPACRRPADRLAPRWVRGSGGLKSEAPTREPGGQP